MSESNYGGGFVIRLVILLVILGIVVVLYFQDGKMTAAANTKIEDAMNLINKETDDGGGIPKDMVSKELEMEPSTTVKDGDYEVDTYTFDRAIPFASKPYLTAVFKNGALVQMLPNTPYDKDKVEEKFIPNPRKIDPSELPTAALSGPAPPSNNDDEEKEDEEKEDDEKSDDSSDEKADEKADEKSDEKSDDSSDEKADEKSDDSSDEKADESSAEKGDG
ncbi:MAG: hypothetical protein MK108_06290 [Mariniblastus sp.]|nr:hypothetical protein [Mariniblastus sp.]